VPNHGATVISDEGHRQLARFAQRVDNKVLGVAGVRRIHKRGDSERLNGMNVGVSLFSNFEVHLEIRIPDYWPA
jgi:hypothetical protein